MPAVTCPFCSAAVTLPDPWTAPGFTCPHCRTAVSLTPQAPAPAAPARPVPRAEPARPTEVPRDGRAEVAPRPANLQGVRRDLRRRSWLLRSVQIRLTARRAFDLAHFGTGPVERLCAALILAAAFVFAALGVSLAAKLSPTYGLLLAGVALVSVLGTSAVLVLWVLNDEELKAQRVRLGDEVLGLREQAAELADIQAEADARFEEEAEREAAGRREDSERRRPARDARPRTKRCPYCREVIPIRALKCRQCGEILDERLARERARAWHPGVAAVLSFFAPGLGQLYKAQVLSGLVWHFLIDAVYTVSIVGTFFCCGLGLLGLPVAIGLHVICIFDAASGRS